MSKKATWKNCKVLPNRILKYLQSISKLGKDGKVSFLSQPDNFFLPEKNLLTEFLKIKCADEITISNSVKSALDSCIINNNISAGYFLDKVNEELDKRISIISPKYLLTTLSLKHTSKLKPIDIFESSIKFYKNKFPRKFGQYRKNLLDKNNLSDHERYIKCIVTTKTYSNDIEVHMSNLNILRAILCLSINEGFNISFGKEKNPLNEIRFGEAHSLHHQNGEPVIPYPWYEPEFVIAFTMPEIELDRKFIKSIINKISSSKYSNLLKDTLIIYIKALDESDHNLAITLLWNSIDKLLNKSKGNYDEISNRVKKIFGHDSRFIDIVEGVKFIRNTYVHDAISNQQSKFYCLALRVLFKKIFIFHLDFFSKDLSLDEALEVIDLLDKPILTRIALEIHNRLNS